MNDEDLRYYRIQPRAGGGVSWDAANMAQEKGYDLTNPEITLLKQARETLDREKRITEQILDTCIKVKAWELPEEKEMKPEKSK
jgi:hypothetical protein